ncbi:hypothetical protein Ga0074812_104307 [Parafrankia irregularis]|uniref:Uncharacterized protein n=1 Tax=Parafrankia irregularis TaxID=795642 RepID=A0A0S4QL39_9ACTN|nr:hypothetical protein Ga0074812_104307 [Parafrankia irregularis]
MFDAGDRTVISAVRRRHFRFFLFDKTVPVDLNVHPGYDE